MSSSDKPIGYARACVLFDDLTKAFDSRRETSSGTSIPVTRKPYAQAGRLRDVGRGPMPVDEYMKRYGGV